MKEFHLRNEHYVEQFYTKKSFIGAVTDTIKEALFMWTQTFRSDQQRSLSNERVILVKKSPVVKTSLDWELIQYEKTSFISSVWSTHHLISFLQIKVMLKHFLMDRFKHPRQDLSEDEREDDEDDEAEADSESGKGTARSERARKKQSKEETKKEDSKTSFRDVCMG